MNSLKKQTHYDSIFIALVPIVICATVMYSARVLLLCAAAMFTARVTDVAIAAARHLPVDTEDKSAIVAAVIFVMMMPVSVPVYMVVVTVAISTLIGKHAFGGKGVYPFNLSALSMCIAAVNWPEKVFTAVKPFARVDFWTGACRSTATQSSTIKAGGLPYVDMLDLLTGNYAGAMGSSFVLLTVAIAVCLLITKKITWHVPVSFLTVCTLFALAFPRIYGISRLNSVKLEILSSSLIFVTLFMLCEPDTTPKKPRAKIIFGALAGIITMLYRYFGAYEIGACFAILLVNATESFWDRMISGDFIKEFLARETSVRNTKQSHKKKSKTGKNTALDKPKAEKLTVADKKTEITEEILQNFSADTARAPKKQAAKEPDKNGKKQQKVTDMIAEAEDKLDNVEFSTRTIDIDAILKEIDKQGKGGKK